MDVGNKTALRRCRFLDRRSFSMLYETFLEAFADYVIPFALTEQQFRNHINLNAVDLDRSVGCVESDRLVGFSLNGFGLWNGKLTVYNAGTGVVPWRRRRGVSRAMFEMILPVFTEAGIEQFLLEVIKTNTGAVALYDHLGFRPVRDLALLQRDERMLTVGMRCEDVDIRNIEDPNWTELTSFWDGLPSWQNSCEAVDRSRANKVILGAYAADRCVGYIVFSSKFGRVAQLAVDREYRRHGVGTALVIAMQNETAGFSMQAINVDKSVTSAMDFFLGLGFYERAVQYEMLRPL
jgi:ribosomal protein S18 acetylase RimI-like enzyme